MKKLTVTALLVSLFMTIGFPAYASGPHQNGNQMRIALSLGQGAKSAFEEGYVFKRGNRTATNLEQLQKLYNEAGATEMFVRINTKRYNDGDLSVDPAHAELHSLESGLEICRVASKLRMPINPEIMVAYTYMDSFSQQAPDFKDYPEIVKPNKPWSEYTLAEMKSVLKQYGELVARELQRTGCQVDYWNLGNEANFGFGGVSIGLKTAVNPLLESKTLYDMFVLPSFGADWLKDNVWNYNGQMMAALAEGIRKVDRNAKFSTHVTTSVADATSITTFFQTLAANGFTVDQAGISFYPTSMTYNPDPVGTVKSMITAVHQALGVPVFIAEYAYPSSPIDSGTYQEWDTPVAGYAISESDQARFTEDFLAWGKDNGVSGIRPWAPDLITGEWSSMSLFNADPTTKIATAKPILDVFDDCN
ncbi:glycosyl hydrolase 53 family protein [Cohnella thailandensis]|uniref:Arabinogalactan endo-beta-1,4-galactanase n=1 Tax=Cohnella thailandensis TaxID=557557 RepID=A0A841SYD3_9BACL|nr:glycosyl hydrolase 53 family protein [Cohnella thailandensis]MBB6634607.1 glycosyl hydrolase 53 family protein [Cohnella thailandensis]MBP1972837.1 arabinogalactan endo-1,4-beta-galactosidase [Cohnella thailandensis]